MIRSVTNRYCWFAAGLLCAAFAASQSVADEPSRLSTSVDQNWPQWRGPNGTGVANTRGVVTNWGTQENLQWRFELPEAGNSTPAVWDQQIFVTQPLSDAQERALLCIDRGSGVELWRRSISYSQAEPTHRTNPYCSATPATDGERVIAWFGSAGLVCWDMQGNELWRRDFGKQEHMWGYGSSPILHKHLCILSFGPGSNEFLIAVDKATGKTIWKIDGLADEEEFALSGPENDGNANDFKSAKPRSERLRGAWSTPIIIDVGERTELVATMSRRVAAYDPLSGELLWKCGGSAPLAYASPVESDGVIVALGGYSGASLAVRAGGNGDVTETHRLWHKPRDRGWLGTGAAVNGKLYACDMGGVVSCIDVQTGEELWKDRTGGGGTWSSITQTTEGRMFLLTKSGTTTVFEPDSLKFAVLAENKLDETTNASVVVAGNQVLIRTDDALWSFADPATRGAE